MAAVTAAVVGAVVAAGSTAYSAYSASQAGGGSPGNPQFRQAPADPLDRAMRSYYARTTLANADKTYPAFNEYLSSGGDPSKNKFDLDMQDLKPSEAAAFGFTGGRGETIPYGDYEGLASGDIKNLSPDQILYLAKERRRQAMATGQPVGKWAGGVLRTNNRLGRVSARLDALEALDDPNRRQQRRITRLTDREARLQERQRRQLNPDEA